MKRAIKIPPQMLPLRLLCGLRLCLRSSSASAFGGTKHEREKGEETKEAAEERKGQGWGEKVARAARIWRGLVLYERYKRTLKQRGDGECLVRGGTP